MMFRASNEAGYELYFGVTSDVIWALCPNSNNYLNLGSPSTLLAAVYASTGQIVTSDRNLKNNIKPIDEKYEKLFALLSPVSFLFNDGKSGRTHVGFVSQDVEDAMNQVGLTDLEFAGFCKDKTQDGDYIYSLRYDEFVSLNTHMIQKLQSRVDQLESRIERLESLLEATKE